MRRKDGLEKTDAKDKILLPFYLIKQKIKWQKKQYNCNIWTVALLLDDYIFMIIWLYIRWLLEVNTLIR